MFNENNSIRTGYTLTNEAPEVGQLNPYNTSTDSLVITKGNTDLRPMQQHYFQLSYTFNKAGLYITPYIGYGICVDIIEPFGYSQNGIYTSSYHNSGRFRSLTAGGSISYNLNNWGRIYISCYQYTDYFTDQDPRKSFSYSAGMTAKYKKWYLGIDYNQRNYTYTAVSRTKYHTPDFSMAQLQYNFTPTFYISIALQYFTGAVRQDIETYSDSYRSFVSQRMLDLNVRPWILIRYTIRKNDKQKIKLNNIITSKEKGVVL
jgi:predicted porin